jgi:hypothetical protein
MMRYLVSNVDEHKMMAKTLAIVDSIGSLHKQNDREKLFKLHSIRDTVQGCPVS